MSEEEIQREVIRLLRLSGKPGIVFFHVPNGERRDRVTAARLKGLGVEPGVPDLWLVLPPDGRNVALELKRPGGRLSPVQVEMHERLRDAGMTVLVADSLGAAVEALESVGALRTRFSQRTTGRRDA